MKVLSLFDGMSCGMIAFRQLGIPVDEYHAFEIDKFAVKVSQHNFPEIIHHGDVFQGDFANLAASRKNSEVNRIQGFDWLIGGSPCTYWSIAQNPQKREVTASGIGWELFQQYVRALHETEPEYFLYENNYSMSAAIRDSISELFGFEPIMINSALVSAQSRKRLYWVGASNHDGTYSKCRIRQPKDRKIFLKDVIDGVAMQDKAYTVTATEYKDSSLQHSINRHIRTRVAMPVNADSEGKSRTIKAQYSNTSIANLVRDDHLGASGEAIRIGHIGKGGQAERIYSVCGKSVTLKGNGGGGGGKTGLYKIDLPDGDYIIRKLTVSECMRLQTVPDWYDFSVISNTQAYKCLGNGWTVKVIMHLIPQAMQGKTEPCYKQLGFF